MLEDDQVVRANLRHPAFSLDGIKIFRFAQLCLPLLCLVLLSSPLPARGNLRWVNTIRRRVKAVSTSFTSLPKSKDIELVQPCEFIAPVPPLDNLADIAIILANLST
jgi:hypothetical protein